MKSVNVMIKLSPISFAFFVLILIQATLAEANCFESRKDATPVVQKTDAEGNVNVECSPTTGGVLLWHDPFEGTVPLSDLPDPNSFLKGEAVFKPRTDKLVLYPICGVACHNGTFPPPVTNENPRPLTMHMDLVPDAMNLQHGRGAIWCLDCHHKDTRNKFIDHRGNEISFDEPQKLCGKCHGPAYRDWRDGVHGKRIGEWETAGKKRWWVCTECHNPHDIQQGTRNSGFEQIEPEPAPRLPKGLENADHERH